MFYAQKIVAIYKTKLKVVAYSGSHHEFFLEFLEVASLKTL